MAMLITACVVTHTNTYDANYISTVPAAWLMKLILSAAKRTA